MPRRSVALRREERGLAWRAGSCWESVLRLLATLASSIPSIQIPSSPTVPVATAVTIRPGTASASVALAAIRMIRVSARLRPDWPHRSTNHSDRGRCDARARCARTDGYRGRYGYGRTTRDLHARDAARESRQQSEDAFPAGTGSPGESSLLAPQSH